MVCVFLIVFYCISYCIDSSISSIEVVVVVLIGDSNCD